MVIKNPIQLTKVSEEPFTSGGAFWAIRVENMGESAMTTTLQKHRNVTSPVTELHINSSGDIIQQLNDNSKAMMAVFLALMCCDIYPLATQDKAPAAMMKNDNRGTFIALAVCFIIYSAGVSYALRHKSIYLLCLIPLSVLIILVGLVWEILNVNNEFVWLFIGLVIVACITVLVRELATLNKSWYGDN